MNEKKIAALVLSLLAFFAVAAEAARTETVVDSIVQPGFFEQNSPGWVPLLVKLNNKSNNTLDLDVIVKSMRYGGKGEAFTVHMPVSLSPKAAKKFFMYIYTASSSVTYEIREKGGGAMLLEPYDSDRDEKKVYAKAVEGLSISGEWRSEYNVLLIGAKNPNALESFNGKSIEFTPRKLASTGGYHYYSSSSYGPSGPVFNAQGRVKYVAGAEELPDLWIGYGSTDVIILNGADMGAMSTDQKRAIVDYVRMGGTLVISPPDVQWLADAKNLAHDLMKIDEVKEMTAGALNGYCNEIGVPNPGDAMRLVEVTVAGAKGSSSSDVTKIDPREIPPGGVSKVVEVNNGRVYFLPFDIGRMYPAAAESGVPFRLDGRLAGLFLKYYVFREPDLIYSGSLTYYGYGSFGPETEGALLKNDVARAVDLSAANLLPLWVLTLIAVVYVLLVAPANFLVLRRWRKPLLFAASVPIIVFVYTIIIFAIGYISKGVTSRYSEIAVVEATAGSGVGASERLGGIYCAGPGGLTLGYEGRNVPCPYYLNSTTREDASVKFALLPGDDQCPGVQVEDLPLRLWQMGYIESKGPCDLGNGVRIEKSETGCKITNNSLYDLGPGVLALYHPFTGLQYYAFNGARKGEEVSIAYGGGKELISGSFDGPRLTAKLGYSDDSRSFPMMAMNADVYRRFQDAISRSDAVLITPVADSRLPFAKGSWLKRDAERCMNLMIVRLPKK
jgi:hypothetical protein